MSRFLKTGTFEIWTSKNFFQVFFRDYNYVDDILRLFGIWENFDLATSETKHDH